MHPTLHCHSQACHCQAGVCCLWRTFRDKQRLLVYEVWLKKTLVNLIEAQVKGFLGLVLRFLSPKPPSRNWAATHNLQLGSAPGIGSTIGMPWLVEQQAAMQTHCQSPIISKITFEIMSIISFEILTMSKIIIVMSMKYECN